MPAVDDPFDVLIVGAGHAGAHVAIALRQAAFSGTIGLLGAEPDLPYERPPLSKAYLSAHLPFERLLIRSPAFWAERRVTMLPRRTVVGVTPQANTVSLADGSVVRYRQLVWATGGAARNLTCPGSELAGVHTMRTRADVDRLTSELSSTRRVVVIGGGYIGLEAAATLTQLGKNVTILEALDRVLARVAAEPISRFYEAEHRAHGVGILLNARVTCIESIDGRASGVRLDDGDFIPADMIIVGIGIVPAVQPLLAAGARGGNGVLVDAQCRTSLPGIFAVGDCALHASEFADGALIRLESVQNATDQATVAARTLCGIAAANSSLPWFWSQQYDLRLQTAGLHLGHDQVVVRGDPATRSFAVLYLKAGRLIALDCVNATADFSQGKALIAGRAVIEAALLRDTAMTLKSHRARPA